MTFHEPTPESLKALAGWSLSKRENASNAQVLALHKFSDGCAELADNFPEAKPLVQVVSKVTKSPPIYASQYVPQVVQSHGQGVIPPDVLAIIDSNLVQNGECQHRFHIQTQRCVGCGKTYFEAKGVKPQLMS